MKEHTTHFDDCGCKSAAYEAEVLALREALYPLVVGCLMADAREDAPEFVNGEAEAGRRALPECPRCNGCGATDGVEYVDVEIPEAVRCHECGGWGFLSRSPGGSAALEAFAQKVADQAFDIWRSEGVGQAEAVDLALKRNLGRQDGGAK